jgi:hypothetical protein
MEEMMPLTYLEGSLTMKYSVDIGAAQIHSLEMSENIKYHVK